MTAPVPNATPIKKDTRKRCSVCSKKFTPTHASQKYHPGCAPAAKKKAARSPRKPKQLPLTNQLVRTMIRAARYAGTVQLFEGITVAQLHELLAMVKLRNQFSQTAGCDEKGRPYEGHLSHIHSVRGGQGIGKFTPDNLVVSDRYYNRELGNTHLGFGACIPPNKEQGKWMIEKHHTDAEVMELIIECIGRPTWDKFAKEAKLQPGGTQLLMDALAKLIDPHNPDHAKYLRAYKDPSTSTQELRKLHEAITGKTTYVPYVEPCSPVDLVLHELERMAKYRPELAQVHAALSDAIAAFVKATGRRASHLEFYGNEYRAFMDILHGDAIDPEFLARFHARCSEVPVYAPIVRTFTVPEITPEQLARAQEREARIASRAAAEIDELDFIGRVQLESPELIEYW